MTSIGIKEARQNLRELIERVERGALITITRQGKAVAQLPALRANRRTLCQSAPLNRLIQQHLAHTRCPASRTRHI